MTTYGKIAIDWKREGEKFTLSCEVPVGSTATVCVPFGAQEPKIKQDENVIFKGVRDGYALYKVRSGRYEFNSTL